MRKNCKTCKHDDAEYPSYPHKTPCNECEHTSDAPTKWEAADHYKPITNADRIRAMSDEELAETIARIGYDLYSCAESMTDDIELLKTRNKCDDRCGGCILNWLKQPAE